MTEIYTIERKFELLSGENIDNEYRTKTKKRIERIMEDLQIVTINLDAYKILMSEKGENIRKFSPAFVYSFVYSSFSTNILLISNLFCKNNKVLSLYKLINGIENDKLHLECRLLERREKKDSEWKLINDGKLQKEINKWRQQIEELQGDIITKIDTLRDKVYAHKDISFLDKKQEYYLSIDEFEMFVQKIFDFLNMVCSCVFYECYAFFDHSHPDIEQALNMINTYRKYKNDFLTLKRKKAF